MIASSKHMFLLVYLGIALEARFIFHMVSTIKNHSVNGYHV